MTDIGENYKYEAKGSHVLLIEQLIQSFESAYFSYFYP